jgi:hypothetical protein
VKKSQAPDDSMHEVRLIDERVKRAFHAHPLADDIPQREAGIHALGPHLQQPVEEFMRHREAASGLGRVVADAGRLNLPRMNGSTTISTGKCRHWNRMRRRCSS